MTSIHETEVLAGVKICKRLAKRGLKPPQIRELTGHNPERIRKYIKWPECKSCGAILRKASKSRLCGLCELPPDAGRGSSANPDSLSSESAAVSPGAGARAFGTLALSGSQSAPTPKAGQGRQLQVRK